MKELYLTITGVCHYYGIQPFRPGRKVQCVKEPQNPHDAEAIRCRMKHIGTVGYVANSVYTVIPGTRSAGALNCRVKRKFTAEVLFVTKQGVICRVTEGRKTKKQKEPEVLQAEDGLASDLPGAEISADWKFSGIPGETGEDAESVAEK